MKVFGWTCRKCGRCGSIESVDWIGGAEVFEAHGSDCAGVPFYTLVTK